jgi:hypothetical protein
MKVSRGLLMFMRLALLVQLIVGIGLWAGHFVSLVDVHRTIGVLFVLSLWIIAIIALVQRRSPGLAVFGILWGLAVAGLGFMQQGMMVGDLHWIIRVLHLAIGIAAMPIAEKLAAAGSARVAAVSA